MEQVWDGAGLGWSRRPHPAQFRLGNLLLQGESPWGQRRLLLPQHRNKTQNKAILLKLKCKWRVCLTPHPRLRLDPWLGAGGNPSSIRDSVGSGVWEWHRSCSIPHCRSSAHPSGSCRARQEGEAVPGELVSWARTGRGQGRGSCFPGSHTGMARIFPLGNICSTQLNLLMLLL